MNRPDPILATVARAVFFVVLLFAFHMLWRGHYLPGGGFIAGLIVSAALVLYRIAFGQAATSANLRVMLPWGLGLALLTGFVPFVLGLPFLTSDHGDVETALTGKFSWATAFVFDVGVFLVVIGATMGVIRALTELPAKEVE